MLNTHAQTRRTHAEHAWGRHRRNVPTLTTRFAAASHAQQKRTRLATPGYSCPPLRPPPCMPHTYVPTVRRRPRSLPHACSPAGPAPTHLPPPPPTHPAPPGPRASVSRGIPEVQKPKQGDRCRRRALLQLGMLLVARQHHSTVAPPASASASANASPGGGASTQPRQTAGSSLTARGAAGRAAGQHRPAFYLGTAVAARRVAARPLVSWRPRRGRRRWQRGVHPRTVVVVVLLIAEGALLMAVCVPAARLPSWWHAASLCRPAVPLGARARVPPVRADLGELVSAAVPRVATVSAHTRHPDLAACIAHALHHRPCRQNQRAILTTRRPRARDRPGRVL